MTMKRQGCKLQIADRQRQLAIGNRRGAFTLIEMLVVIGIMLVLGSIIVGVSLRNSDRQKSLDGADRVSGWLLLAKQWALRDQAPRGVRLVIDNNPASPTYRMVVTRNPIAGDTQAMVGLQYIEQPEDWVAPPPFNLINYTDGNNIVTGGLMPPLTAPYPTNYPFAPDFSGGYGGNVWDSRWPVGPGDMLEMDSGTNAKVAVIYPAPWPTGGSNPPSPIYMRPNAFGTAFADGTSRYELWLHPATLPPSPYNFNGTNWRIIRQPRPRPGESPLTMPRDIVIDLNSNNLAHPTNPGRAYGWEPQFTTVPPWIDIMFAPSGAVIGSFSTDLKLWVRDVTAPQPVSGNPYLYGGEFFIVTVSIRTGLISVHPADRTLNTLVSPIIYQQPYSFSQDGRSSGL